MGLLTVSCSLKSEVFFVYFSECENGQKILQNNKMLFGSMTHFYERTSKGFSPIARKKEGSGHLSPRASFPSSYLAFPLIAGALGKNPPNTFPARA